ncbi:hypothetical protein B5V89_05070 [Heyndrickxia sporothermodurans]|uniref:phage tail tape measure protein n=1 Tax=Heyndrickxia sporothermodurans TaxID=46224 RepID=UPI000D39693A|nr:replication protein [Heyndrickxia sporothermodurans]PTY79618.1 hypothetical protein B5V89_05070 [Heyndrickxia sporothermodurans]
MAKNNHETKVTFKVFNEEFNKAMSEMDNSSRKMRKELKLEQEELKLTGTESQKLESKIKGLQQQYDIARQKTQATAEQLAKAKKYFGENSNEANKLENKLLDLKISQEKLGNSLQQAKTELSKQGQQFQDVAKDADKAKKSVGELGDEFENVAGALVAGGGIAGAIDQALDVSDLKTKIDISFEVPEESKKTIKDAVRGIQAYGLDAEAALEGVRRQWALNKNASDSANKEIVKGAAVISKAYDGIDFIELIQENNEVAAALKISNKEALGLINSLLKAGFPPEQLDTISEYGQQMKDIGFTSAEIQAIFEAGINTKTWNIDNLNDGVKEARIQMATFGLEVPKALKPLITDTGISVGKFQKWGEAVAGGGEKGSKAMSEVASWLDGIKDKTVKNEIATKVFGTKWEDQGQNMIAVFKGLGDVSDKTKQNVQGLTDATTKMDANPAVQMKQAMADLKTALEPTLTIIAGVVSNIAQWASKNPTLTAAIIAIVSAVGILSGAILALTPIITPLITGFTKLWEMLSKLGPIIKIVRGAMMALTGPIGIISAIVVALAILIIKNWDSIKKATSKVWNGIKSTISTVVNAIKNIVSKVWNSIKSTTSTVWNGIKTVISTVWGGIKSVTSNSINSVKSLVSTVWNSIKSTTSTVWNGIKGVINTVWGGIKTAVSTPINWVKSKVSGVWSSIKTNTSSVWNGIKSAMISPIENARDKIKGIVDRIKSFFSGLKLSLPKIKLPHLSITGGFSIMPPRVPKFSIEWYRKGGIFDEASVIGIGEAGKEAALPLVGKEMNPFADAVANRMLSTLPQMAESKMASEVTNHNSVTIYANVRNDRDIDKLAEKIDGSLNTLGNRRNAAWGGA